MQYMFHSEKTVVLEITLSSDFESKDFMTSLFSVVDALIVVPNMVFTEKS